MGHRNDARARRGRTKNPGGQTRSKRGSKGRGDGRYRLPLAAPKDSPGRAHPLLPLRLAPRRTHNAY
jgi:hypothetical protein